MTIFNVPYLTGNEVNYIQESVDRGKISGDGYFTNKCHNFFESQYNFKKVLLTTSCTDAIELAALLINVQPGDEIIVPSFTFVSTVNPFILRGAKVIFVDSRIDHPGLDEDLIESLVTHKTKAIVLVHYAGIACDMDKILMIAKRYNIYIIEDAAQAIDSYYKGKPLGSFGHLSAFSFHETKNIMCGEGGMIVINDAQFIKRAEILREKGTNRSAFFRGEIDKYGWVDIGSSFLPSDILAAFLFAQIQNLTNIQERRKHIWELYYSNLLFLGKEGHIMLPAIPDYATNNAHMFYLVCRSISERSKLINFLKDNEIQAVFHYQSLHKSPFFKKKYDSLQNLPQCDRYSDCLVRLPMYYSLSDDKVIYITQKIKEFYELSFND